MSDFKNKILAAASHTSSVTFDLIEAATEEDPHGIGSLANGETATVLADALRLVLQVTQNRETKEAGQLCGSIIRFLESRP